jgi:hypothetical protein
MRLSERGLLRLFQFSMRLAVYCACSSSQCAGLLLRLFPVLNWPFCALSRSQFSMRSFPFSMRLSERCLMRLFPVLDAPFCALSSALIPCSQYAFLSSVNAPVSSSQCALSCAVYALILRSQYALHLMRLFPVLNAPVFERCIVPSSMRSFPVLNAPF